MIRDVALGPQRSKLTLDDHSKVVPRLPFPNRTVKRLCADDSGCTSVKVGHRQAPYPDSPRPQKRGFVICATQTTNTATAQARGTSTLRHARIPRHHFKATTTFVRPRFARRTNNLCERLLL